MLDFNQIKTLTIFGDGITANAVKKKLEEFNEFKIVSANESPDLGVISPGLTPSEYTSKYSYPIISEIELAYYLFLYVKKKPFFIAITGTNGKTTTTHLVASLLNIAMAGNVGIPLINYVSKDTQKIPDMLSVELSSYQLEQSPCFHPEIYILLNITEDHLNRHKTIDNYTQVKLSPVYTQTKSDYFIYNGTDAYIQKNLDRSRCKSQLIDFKSKRAELNSLLILSPLFGEHNIDNLLATLCAVQLVTKNDLSDKIKKLKSVPHRLEKTGIINSIQFINDSKATNPDSTNAALASFNLKNVILLLGGKRKEVSYESTFAIIRKHNVRVILFGGDRDYFKQELKDYGHIIGNEKTMTAATRVAYQNANKNDIILLSPGCASFDEFQNFEERGNAFKQFVSGLSTNQSS